MRYWFIEKGYRKLKFFLKVALLLTANVAYSANTDNVNWLLGRYDVKVSGGKVIAFRVKMVDEKLVAVKESDRSGAIEEHPIAIMSANDMAQMFGPSIKELSSIKCFTTGLLVVCSSLRDMKIEEANISIAKGFFGVALDVGIIEVTRKE